ncbi:MAG TPA: IS256 family transposase [Woeseiaceae bacterium]|nr:IS256 family transposase [Woeseiaceae bacterium]
MKRRVPASKQTRKRIEDLISGVNGKAERSDLVKLASRLIIEEALESEVQAELGREYYGRGELLGHRNGYRRGKLDTAEGRIEYAVPQVRGIAGWRSAVREALSGRSEELERLAIEMYARGLSVRDIEAAFVDEAGRCVLSRSAVSAVTERLWADYQAFASRDLSAQEVLYLFVDGIAERLHVGQPRDAVLAAWGITSRGNKVLLGLLPGTKEDTVCCKEFLRDLKSRGLVDPVLVITDGAPGLIRAVEEVFPRSLRQRCLAHRIRNLQGKVPADLWPEVKGLANAAYRASSPALARLTRDEFVKRFEAELPSATRCFLDDFEACIAHLRLPISHRRAIRTTNLLERLFGEERRRTKVIPHAFGERAVLKLMFAALLRASQTWQRVAINEFELRQIEDLKNELDEKFRQRSTSTVTTASRRRIYSKLET